jgi:hypothetical protein
MAKVGRNSGRPLRMDQFWFRLAVAIFFIASPTVKLAACARGGMILRCNSHGYIFTWAVLQGSVNHIATR